MRELAKAVRITDKVWWVGAIDWAIRDFHGYATERGSTYNAYLVMADKITLVDTVKAPFKDELLSRISSVIDPSKIDYIVSNHSEMDHSGSLPEIVRTVRPEKVFASPAGEKALKAHFDIDFEISPVKTGDTLGLGNMNMSFVETRMLHWPDSMFTYLDAEKLLFSQDAFGMHLATASVFEDENPRDVTDWEAVKYFANILLPYSGRIISTVDDIPSWNLDIKMIAPDHGPVWRRDIMRIIEKYREWAEQKPRNKALIVYDTMWQSTAKMARSICDGLRDAGVENIVTAPLSSRDRSYVATEILEAGAMIVGSPTLNNNIFPSVVDVMTYLKGLRPQNLIGASFGSYGWSGESVAQLDGILREMKVGLVSDGLKIKYVPDEQSLEQCYELGRQTAEALRKKITEA